MNLKDIKDLIDKIDSSNISYFEVKVDDAYIKMDKSLTRNLVDMSTSNNNTVESKVIEEKEVVLEKTTSELTNEIIIDDITDETSNYTDYIVKSPMVGTFYEAPGIDQDSFVKVGDKIKQGDILCIIEAMKLMNEIESEISGEVVEIIAKNGAMVEYGEALFKVRR